MTDLIEDIGPILGVAAFLGLSILAFLIFQQAREVRRLRDWAGRAPERAEEAAEARAAAAEAQGEEVFEDPGAAAVPTGRLATLAGQARERIAPAWDAIDRRSPFDPRYFLVVVAALVVAAAVLTSGFGLGGDDDAGKGGRAAKGKGSGSESNEKVQVTVLNATQDDTAQPVIAGVRGLADDVAEQVVKPAGFGIATKDDANSGFAETVIMYEPEGEEDAQRLAEAVAETLGETEVQPIVDEVAQRAAGAAVVLVVGRDDSEALGAPG